MSQKPPSRINGLTENSSVAEAEAIRSTTGIRYDIFSIVDDCYEWHVKMLESLKVETVEINQCFQDLEPKLYWSLENSINGWFVTLFKQSQEGRLFYTALWTILKQHQNEVNEIRTERLARTANPLALVAQQQPVYHHQNHPTQNTQYSSTRSQQSTRNRGKAIVTSSAPTYDPEPATVTEDGNVKGKGEIDKLML
ncbi:hypothetical protein Tco_1401540 [Tanacetum coccineum]